MENQTNVNKFFEVLFPEPEAAFTSITDELRGKESTEVVAIFPHEHRRVRERFCINSLYSNKDLNPNDFWHNLSRGRRADVNVSVFRNILIECDKVSVEEQIKWLNENRLPFSAVIHSGGKSLHVIVSLKEPVRSKKEYVKLAKSLYAAIKNSGLAVDDSCSNPSRLTRYPEVVRSSTNVKQSLMFLGEHVDNGILKTWIKQREPRAVRAKKQKERLTKREAADKFISKTTEKLIKEHIYYTESRHEAFKKAAVQLRRAGYEIEEIEGLLSEAYSRIIPERNELKSLLKWVDKNVILE